MGDVQRTREKTACVFLVVWRRAQRHSAVDGVRLQRLDFCAEHATGYGFRRSALRRRRFERLRLDTPCSMELVDKRLRTRGLFLHVSQFSWQRVFRRSVAIHDGYFEPSMHEIAERGQHVHVFECMRSVLPGSVPIPLLHRSSPGKPQNDGSVSPYPLCPLIPLSAGKIHGLNDGGERRHDYGPS